MSTRPEVRYAPCDGGHVAYQVMGSATSARPTPSWRRSHTGEVELRGRDVDGLAVHIGQRVCAVAGAGEVVVSRTVGDLVAGGGFALEDLGEHELRGITGSWRLFRAG